jgi:hypothetical protein
MIHVLYVLGTLLVGGLLTSTAEYKFNYNLVDLILEKIGYGVRKAEQEAKKL